MQQGLFQNFSGNSIAIAICTVLTTTFCGPFSQYHISIFWKDFNEEKGFLAFCILY